MAYTRFVALGDSFTEGVGDPDDTRPGGLAGWADRVADQLGATNPDFGYANLAIRGRKLHDVVAQQIEPALALKPDLVTLYAGGNDIMRPKVDIDALVATYAEAVGRLRLSGADVVLFTGFDPGGSAVFNAVRSRFALYNELVREVADNYGCGLVDFWRMRELRDWRYWGVDRIHLSTYGHRFMAVAVLDYLQIPHEVPRPVLPEKIEPSRRERAAADLAWAKQHAAPWIVRRVTGRSSGDGIEPKRPTLHPVG